MKKVLIFVATILSAISLFAATVTVGWTPNSETNILGYKILWGTQSGNYVNTTTVTNNLQWMVVTPVAGTNYTNILIQSHATNATVSGVSLGLTNYFNVVAYNTAGQTGPLGTEVTAIVFPSAPTKPSAVQNFRVLSVTP